jgi:hypothetical protein
MHRKVPFTFGVIYLAALIFFQFMCASPMNSEFANAVDRYKSGNFWIYTYTSETSEHIITTFRILKSRVSSDTIVFSLSQQDSGSEMIDTTGCVYINPWSSMGIPRELIIPDDLTPIGYYNRRAKIPLEMDSLDFPVGDVFLKNIGMLFSQTVFGGNPYGSGLHVFTRHLVQFNNMKILPDNIVLESQYSLLDSLLKN